MRIGILCHSSCGGSARVATELAAELARRGHKVHLFARTTPFGCTGSAQGLVLHRIMSDGDGGLHPAELYAEWPANEYQAFLARLVQVCAEERIEVLHFHYAIPFAFLAAEVRRQLGRGAPALVGTLHGTDVIVYGRDPVQGPGLADALRSLDAVTTVSRSLAGLAVEILGLPAWPEVIPNSVDLARFRPPSSDTLHRDVRSDDGPGCLARPRIIHVSNFRRVKDPVSVARIFLGIRERMEAELWLVGDGQGMDELKAVLGETEAESDVHCWGLQPDTAPLLAQADLLLMTSLFESFCLVALEAMACGVPVLSTRVGGVPEVVVHGETGYLVPVGEHALAVDLAVGLLSSPARHEAMRDAALARARQFEQKRVVSIYEKLYRGLLVAGPSYRSPCLASV